VRRHGWRRGPRRPAAAVPRLKMTSMMDILTVLLLFLLKSFVVDAGVVHPPPGVELPTSTSEDSPDGDLVVAVTDAAILVGARPVADLDDVRRGNDLLIPALESELRAELDQMDALDARKGREPGLRQVTVQGDKSLEFHVLERVMYTCHAAGFDEMALAVIQEARGA
jgi:biopolymer transport protein ExbD